MVFQKDWKSLFPPHILMRGKDYCDRGLVQELTVKADEITAVVSGSKDYTVHILLNEDGIYDMTCDCPYAEQNKNCKHMAAVIYAADYDKDSDENSTDTERDISIESMLMKVDAGVIKSFLAQLMKQNPLLVKQFKEYTRIKWTPALYRTMKNYIDDIIYKYTNQNKYIDYYQANDFMDEVQSYVDNVTTGLLAANEFDKAFSFTWDVVEKVATVEMDDSDGGLGILSELCDTLWNDILDHGDEDLREHMYQVFMRELDRHQIYYLYGIVEDIVFNRFKEPVYLERKLDFVQHKLQKIDRDKKQDIWQKGYDYSQWLSKYATVLKDMHGDDIEIRKLYKKYWKYDEVRMDFIQLCIRRGDILQAIELLQKEKQEKNSSYSIECCCDELQKLYFQVGDTVAAVKEIWQYVNCGNCPTIEMFRNLRAYYSEEEWPVKRDTLFAATQDSYGLAKLYKEEKLYEELIQLVSKAPGLGLMQSYEQILKPDYATEILKKYKQELYKMAEFSNSRKIYRQYVQILRHMQTYPQGPKIVAEIVDDWHRLYPRRRAMIEELDNL